MYREAPGFRPGPVHVEPGTGRGRKGDDERKIRERNTLRNWTQMPRNWVQEAENGCRVPSMAGQWQDTNTEQTAR